jgi:hypothetical protein
MRDSRRLRVRLALGASALILAALPAAGQGGPPDITRENVEFVGFAGFRTGGSLANNADELLELDGGTSYGGVIDVNLHKGNFKLEALYSHNQSGIKLDQFVSGSSLDIAIDYIQAGILQETGNEKTRFYASVLLGATLFRPTAFDSVTKFSFSVGGGLKIFLGKNVGLRLDARAFATPTEASAGAVCGNGTCLLNFSGSILWQGDFTGGVILAF